MGNVIMRFYHIKQFGRHCICHSDKAYNTEKGLKEVCNRIVEKANKAVKRGLMIAGAFDVIVCNKDGEELDCFLSGTDFTY
jgi:hypothetical protein